MSEEPLRLGDYLLRCLVIKLDRYMLDAGVVHVPPKFPNIP